MSPDEVIGMAIFFGSIVSIIFIIVVGSIIKAWMKKNSSKNLSENQEFLNALREFKENMERRMSNLEEIVIEQDTPTKAVESGPKNRSQSAIQLELNEEVDTDNKSAKDTKLKNMLNN